MKDKMRARKSYTALLLLSVGVLSLGCTPTDSNQVTSETDSRQAETQAAVGAEKSAVTVSHSTQAPVLDQNSLPEIITGMEAGMPYAEARALIDQTIWAPKTHPPLDYVSTSVQNMRDLGYEEVRDCAGTGLGLCRMEFIEREGLVLVIIVTTSEAEPMVWTWDVE